MRALILVDAVELKTGTNSSLGISGKMRAYFLTAPKLRGRRHSMSAYGKMKEPDISVITQIRRERTRIIWSLSGFMNV